MRIRSKTLIAGAALAAASIAGAGIAFSQSGEPAAGGAEQEDSAPDVPITGPELQQATDAALAHLGQGRVTETEKGDEKSLYEVEVTLDDGSEVDVQLDENFAVVGIEVDDANDDD